VHAAELGIVEGDITGVAVNPATRLSQKAAGGKFWVSSTVRDMMPGGSTPFADRGPHALKGFNEHWRLYSVDRS
jgi:class 3 adenylate cyclase